MMHERWLVTGATGQLGGHLVAHLRSQLPHATVVAWTGRKVATIAGAAARYVELADIDAVAREVEAARPTHVLHVAAMTAVADALANPELAQRVNVEATKALAGAARAVGARVAFSSTDMVFGGDHAPYREGDAPKPLSVYGQTKARAEEVLLREGGLVLRIPLLYGLAADGRATTFANQLAALRSGRELRLFTDEFRTPLWVNDAARIMVALARGDLVGVRHVAGPQRLSRYELVRAAARAIGATGARMTPISRLDIPSAEFRPADLSLDDGLLRGERADLQRTPFEIAAQTF